MATMNQKQRDYYVERIKGLCKNRINQIKAVHASEIQDLADKKYEEFLEGIGVSADMKILKTTIETQEEIHERMTGVVQGLKDLYKDIEYDSYYYTQCNYVERYTKFLKACCRSIAQEEFYKTEAGQELKSLERTQDSAIDTVMLDGCNSVELTAKLNDILGTSGLALLPSA